MNPATVPSIQPTSHARKQQKIAVILPAYNEAMTIRETMESFHKALPESEIWVVNNRSVDATEAIALETLQKLACQGGVLNESRAGKGNALRRAFLEIDADVYIMADADLTYPASQARELLEPILTHKADMVVGDRHSSGGYAVENKRQFHSLGNRLVKTLVNRLFHANLTDIMSGYRVFSRRFVKTYPITVDGFEIETDMVLHALDKRFRIVEIPIHYKDRPSGSVSKLNTFSDGARVLTTIGQILRHYRPLKFFGFCALFMFLLGLLAGTPVILEWLQTGFIHHIPLAILATGLEILASLLLSVGLILDSVASQNRRNFEHILLAWQMR